MKASEIRNRGKTKMRKKIDRAPLKYLLEKWEAGILNECQVHQEAEAIWEQGGEWPTYPKEDFRSIAIEVLSQLEVLNQQWIIKEDIPHLLEFLEAMPGEELVAWGKWEDYWRNTDWRERREKLKNNPYYATGEEYIPEE